MFDTQTLPGLAASSEADHAAFGRWLREALPTADRDVERRLNQHCTRRDPPLLIEAAEPLAAAALLSAWSERYRAKHPQVPLFVYHLGCTRESRRLDELLVRLLRALQQAGGIRENLPAAPATRVEILPNWLARAAAGGRLVIVLSGLDGLEGDSADQAMEWLPAYLPANVRLIASAAPGAASEMWRRRDWQCLTLATPARGEVPPAAPWQRYLWAARRGVAQELLARLAPGADSAAAAGVYPGAAGLALAGREAQDRVRRRLLAEGLEQQRTLLELAQALGDEATAEALDGLPWLLVEAGHWEALGAFLARPEVLEVLLRDERREDLHRCWREWGLHEKLIDFYLAQLPRWRELLDPRRYDRLLIELMGALQEALEAPDLGALLKAAVREGVDPLTLAALDHLEGAWLNGRERYAEAEPLLSQALAVRERECGPDHPDTRASRHQLASLLEGRGELGAAAALYRQTLLHREKSVGPREAELIPHLANLAAVLKAENDFQGARPLYERALQIAERRYGNQHPTTAACLDNLAGLMYAGNDYERAEHLYQRALGIAESAFGPAHPATAASAHNLATVLDAREQYRAAETLLRRALEIREQAYGEDHVDTASTVHNLAGVLDAMGRAGEAEPLYRKAVAIWEKLVGVEHTATATSVNNLADLLREQGAYEEAEALYRRNLATWTALLGPEHPHTLMTRVELGTLYADQHRLELAEPLLGEAVEQTRQVLGAENMLHITSVIKLAALLRDAGRRGEAQALLRQTLAAAEGKISMLSPRIQKLRRHLEALSVEPSLQ